VIFHRLWQLSEVSEPAKNSFHHPTFRQDLEGAYFFIDHENGQLQLDDNKPGMGLTSKNAYPDQFNILKHESSKNMSIKL
jgi:hypothetical protein